MLGQSWGQFAPFLRLHKPRHLLIARPPPLLAPLIFTLFTPAPGPPTATSPIPTPFSFLTHTPLRSPFPTHLVKTTLAEVTHAASHARLEGDALPNLDALGLRSDLNDGSRALVPKTHGLLDDERTDRAVLEVVNVRAADTCLGDLDEDLVVLELRDRALWALVVVISCIYSAPPRTAQQRKTSE